MRLFLASIACLALLAAAFATTRGDDADGIQYDEISRSIMPGATPPAPGAFQTDLAQVHDGKLVVPNPMMAQMPTSMMPKLGVGSIFGFIMNPMGALLGMGLSAIMGGVTSGMMNKYRNYESGQLQHVAYYGAMGRAENLATKHVLITDLTKQRQYDLDLATKSYRVVGTPQNFAPGQSDKSGGAASVTLDVHTTKSAGQPIEGADTDLYETIEDVNVTNASGGCRNLHLRLDTVRYVAKTLAAPRGSSTTIDQLFLTHPEFAAGPNCTAQVTTHTDAVAIPGDRLILYSRMTMSMPEMQEQMKAEAAKAQAEGGQLPPWMKNGSMDVSMVTERGNVRRLTRGDTASLFSVPEGFALRP